MAGHYPPPRPAPPYGPPAYGPPPQYRYVPARRPPRRSAGGTIAGIFGGLTAVVVLGILGFSLFGGEGGIGTHVRSAEPRTASRSTVTGNKLYATGALTPVRCVLPRLVPGPVSMRRFMNVLSDCLDASWSRQFKKAGMRFDTPNRVFWQTPGSSPCGSYPAPGA